MPAGLPRGILAYSLAKAPARMTTDDIQIAARRPVIAIVDDDPAVCNSLKFSLEMEGFSVMVFYSGAEFGAASDLGDCACLVIDQTLPDTSGMQLIESLRARHVDIPAILIVGHPHARLAAQAAVAGIPVVEKPLFGNALSAKIRELCNIPD
jgi:FixJ family two-component response regulator